MITQLVTPGPDPVSNLYSPPEKTKSYKSDLSHSNSTNNVRLIFRALSHRNYRLFFSGQGFSLIGTWMQQIEMNWLVLMCFLLNGLSFIAVILAFLAMKITQRERKIQNLEVFQELREGFSYAFGFAPIRSVLLLLALVSLIGMPYTVLIPFLLKGFCMVDQGPLVFFWGLLG